MPEAVVLCAIGFLLIAATTHRFRKEGGTPGTRTKRLLRLAGAAVILVALVHCGTALDGERWVRLIGCASLGAVAVVLLLSAAPARALAPVRMIVRRGATIAR